MKEKFVYVIVVTHSLLTCKDGYFSQHFSSDVSFVFSSKKKASEFLYNIYKNSSDTCKKTFHNDICSLEFPVSTNEGVFKYVYKIRKICLQ